MTYRSTLSSQHIFAGLVVVVVGAGVATAFALSSQAEFTAENREAMATMMAEMDIRPSGNVDRDFATMMTAHHEGAITMARSEWRHGRNEQLHRIAQEIIVEQRQEIEAMQLALKRHVP